MVESEERLDLDALCNLLDENEDSPLEEMEDPDSASVVDLEKKLYEMKNNIMEIEEKIKKQKTTHQNSTKIESSKNHITLLSKDIFDSSSSMVSENVADEIKNVSVMNFQEEENPYIEIPDLSESGQQIQQMLDNQSDSKSKFSCYKQNSTILQLPEKQKKLNSEMVETLSGIRIINPLMSSEKIKERMQNKKIVKISSLESHVCSVDKSSDWVTIGVVVSKSDPRTSKNGKKYSIWKLSDLDDCSKLASLFLFGLVFQQHWKLPVGSVIGILNPSFMDSKESNSSDLAITIDTPYKLMLIGTSKDFGLCKAKRKDGNSCTMVVNKYKCEYCHYHVKSAYQKLSSKRVELQTSFSGVEPRGLKNKILKKQEIMYGGQSFVQQPRSVGSCNKLKRKDKFTLGNLSLQKKANQVIEDDRIKSLNNATQLSNDSSKMADNSSNPNTFQERLNIPSPGSRNLLQHLAKESHKKQVKEGNIVSVTAKDLLKMHQQQLIDKKVGKNSSSPKLGSGLKLGDDIDFSMDISFPKSTKAMSRTELAKLKAINKIRNKGNLMKPDPNAVKPNTKIKEVQDNIIKRLDESMSSESDSPPSKRNCIRKESSTVDFNKIMNMKSSHAREADQEANDRMDIYFNALEKKENMEDKMVSTREIIVDVVSCKMCKYTAYHPSDMCRELRHIVSRHKAKKRFFKCLDCKQRTTSLNKIPSKACRNCHGSNFERVGMWEEKRLKESEKLFIRDEDLMTY